MIIKNIITFLCNSFWSSFDSLEDMKVSLISFLKFNEIYFQTLYSLKSGEIGSHGQYTNEYIF